MYYPLPQWEVRKKPLSAPGAVAGAVGAAGPTAWCAVHTKKLWVLCTDEEKQMKTGTRGQSGHGGCPQHKLPHSDHRTNSWYSEGNPIAFMKEQQNIPNQLHLVTETPPDAFKTLKVSYPIKN